MTILERIVKTEASVQSDIKNAEKKSSNLISSAQEKSLKESLVIKEKADLEISKIHKNLLEESAKIDAELNEMLLTQGNELKKSVEKKKKAIIEKLYKEAIKE